MIWLNMILARYYQYQEYDISLSTVVNKYQNQTEEVNSTSFSQQYGNIPIIFKYK